MKWEKAWAAAELIRLLYKTRVIKGHMAERIIDELQCKVFEHELKSHKARQHKPPHP